MSHRIRKRPRRLRRRLSNGFRGYAIATIAVYGPNADFGSKVVVSIFPDKGKEPSAMKTWHSENQDVRLDHTIQAEMLAFTRAHEAKSTVMPDRIIGCPHQEVIDYPEGSSCPRCPYWSGRDRFTGERIQ
jgi:hypothetical protein